MSYNNFVSSYNKTECPKGQMLKFVLQTGQCTVVGKQKSFVTIAKSHLYSNKLIMHVPTCDSINNKSLDVMMIIIKIVEEINNKNKTKYYYYYYY